MSYHNDRVSGGSISSAWANALADAVGAVENVGFRPIAGGARYTIFREDSTYYRRDNWDGVVDDSNVALHTLFNTAVSALTSGRTSIEYIALRGDLGTISSPLQIDSYTGVNAVGAILKAASGLNDNMIEASASANTDMTLIGGHWNHDKANQTAGKIVYAQNGKRVTVAHCKFSNSYNQGIHIHDAAASEDWKVMYNQFESCNNAGTDSVVNLSGNSHIVCGNIFNDSVGEAIYLFQANHSTISKNQINDSAANAFGIFTHTSTYNLIMGNRIQGLLNDNIDLSSSSHYNAVVSNVCGAANASGPVGIAIVDSNCCLVQGNYIYEIGAHGIGLNNTDFSLVQGNYCINNGTNDNAAGIRIFNASDQTIIRNNVCGDNQGSATQDYGIWIMAAPTNTVVRQNKFFGNVTQPVLNSSATTVFDRIVVPFVDGSAAHDNGWDVDAGGEYARAYVVLPPDVQQVMDIRIYAFSVVTEADAMELDITGNAGASNEPYNTEAISVTSRASSTTNFAANDIILWRITPTQDADIGHMVGGDSLELKVTYAAADGANCATDARLRTVEIHYV